MALGEYGETKQKILAALREHLALSTAELNSVCDCGERHIRRAAHDLEHVGAIRMDRNAYPTRWVLTGAQPMPMARPQEPVRASRDYRIDPEKDAALVAKVKAMGGLPTATIGQGWLGPEGRPWRLVA